MELEQKGFSGFQCKEFFTAWSPEIDFVGTELLKEVEPDVICHTNIKTHAGRSSQGGQLFSYENDRRRMIVSGDIWRELCLSGHWIQDALILRWGELTAEISRKTVSPSEVIDRLLRTPVYERNVDDARRAYRDLDSKECVWTGRTLGRNFDVDHVLPFSLWRNNDLWNLLPADPRVNRDKRDSLPTHTLLKRRREVIMGYWSVLHQSNPVRFEHEISRLAGTRNLDLSNSFNVMLESVEVTALQIFRASAGRVQYSS